MTYPISNTGNAVRAPMARRRSDRPVATPRPSPSLPDRRIASAARADAMRRQATGASATLIRVGLTALMVALVALAIGRLASSPEAALPLSVAVVAGLGAALVAEANRRWQPRRTGHDARSRASALARRTHDTRTRRAQ